MVDLTHATFADLGGDFVDAEAGARAERHSWSRPHYRKAGLLRGDYSGRTGSSGKEPCYELSPPFSLTLPLHACPTAVRAELLPGAARAEIVLTAGAQNAPRMRTFAFSRHRALRIDAHPALRFDHGPGRQGGRSIRRRTDVLLGDDRGGDQDREVPHFPITKAQEAIGKIWGFGRTEETPVDDKTTIQWEDYTVDEINRRIEAVRKWNEKRRLAVEKAAGGKPERIH